MSAPIFDAGSRVCLDGGMLAFLEEGTWLRDVGLPILLTVVVALVATLILRVVVARFKRKLEQTPHLSEAGNLQRAATLAHALSATFVVVVWVVAGMLILNYLDVPLAPFIASAGIVGVALGFGAQSIVKDTLTGFFILLENQFGVGDTVEIRTPANPILGRVEWLTLRATALRAYDGTLHIVPNGNIVLVSNKSRGGPARSSTRTSRTARTRAGPRCPRRVVRRVPGRTAEGRRDEGVGDGRAFRARGRDDERSDVVIRAVAETRPSRKVEVERLLRARITQRLAERGIRAPVLAAPPPTAPEA